MITPVQVGKLYKYPWGIFLIIRTEVLWEKADGSSGKGVSGYFVKHPVNVPSSSFPPSFRHGDIITLEYPLFLEEV